MGDVQPMSRKLSRVTEALQMWVTYERMVEKKLFEGTFEEFVEQTLKVAEKLA